MFTGADEATFIAGSLALRQDRYNLLSRRLRNYQVLAAVLLAINAVAVIDLIIARHRTRVVPYVIEVDGNGIPRNLGAPPEIGGKDHRVVRSLLADWIWHARTITADRDLQNSFLRRAQSYTTGQARTDLTAFLQQKRNPFEAIAQKTVAVAVESILPLAETEDGWEIVWVEQHRPHSGGGHEEKWRALVTIDWNPPKDEVLSFNPLGLEVKTLNWTRVGQLEKETEQ